MRIVELDAGRWIVTLGAGFDLEVVLACGRSWAFVRYRGELVAEVEAGAA
jgi:hypothetical protein